MHWFVLISSFRKSYFSVCKTSLPNISPPITPNSIFILNSVSHRDTCLVSARFSFSLCRPGFGIDRNQQLNKISKHRNWEERVALRQKQKRKTIQQRFNELSLYELDKNICTTATTTKLYLDYRSVLFFFLPNVWLFQCHLCRCPLDPNPFHCALTWNTHAHLT